MKLGNVGTNLFDGQAAFWMGLEFVISRDNFIDEPLLKLLILIV